MNSHLYEILLESSQMWVKIQAPCTSKEQAIAYFGIRFGGKDPDNPAPLYPGRTFDIPTKLRECTEEIANWDSFKDFFPEGWDDLEFNLVGDPYPWCDTLSDGCNCHGSEDRLDTAFVADFGLTEDVDRRMIKSQNVRYAENLRWWQERAAETESSGRAQPPYREAVKAMAESILPAEPDPDRLIIVIVTDRKDPRGTGVLITLKRDPIDGMHKMPVTHYSEWEACLQTIEEQNE